MGDWSHPGSPFCAAQFNCQIAHGSAEVFVNSSPRTNSHSWKGKAVEPFRHYDMEYCHMAYAHELFCENSDCYSKRIPQGAARIGID
ncbi:hypothetical protein BHM03_00037156 [Ensete ventricosum]|uniref:Uncharacterized protein n=1 Tax=Ensete ventricosum TaxID=4639 RepID=A0A426Y3Z5_ENSVE|nr:hypothetical protein B296_00027415 [Ensete ventricosum]RZR74455.1 hypothetical protein BHM03_00037156 [Ensete ventricosum]